MSKRRIVLISILFTLFFTFTMSATFAEPVLDIPDLGLYEKELKSGEEFVIKNDSGKIISKMARVVYEGDEIIAEDDKHYKVYKVEGNTAYAKYVGKHDIDKNYASAAMIQLAQNTQSNTIAIYHTHNDESYIPGDGTESIEGRGGIVDVGELFANKLREKGVNVIHDETLHLPHDSSAYRRSRRTAANLMKNTPAILIDVHRDGIKDPAFYSDKISGVDSTKIRLVVGRQNQNMQSNLEFAKNIKASINSIYPGLVKEIFMAKGNYNQDLSPRTLLIEVGTYTNAKGRAKNGAVLFADALPEVLGISKASPGKGEPATSPQNKSDWTSVLWILVALIVGGAAFLLLSTGSLHGAKDKLKNLVSKEWANYMGQPKISQKEEREEFETDAERTD